MSKSFDMNVDIYEGDPGLPAKCAVNLHNVFTLRRDDLGAYIATLPPDVMARVDRALVFALGVGERRA